MTRPSPGRKTGGYNVARLGFGDLVERSNRRRADPFARSRAKDLRQDTNTPTPPLVITQDGVPVALMPRLEFPSDQFDIEVDPANQRVIIRVIGGGTVEPATPVQITTEDGEFLVTEDGERVIY